MEVTDILNQRAVTYGNYDVGVDVRATMMIVLNSKHIDSKGVGLSENDRVLFSDILLKIMRAASDPSYIDSWTDLEGYARLIKEMKIKEMKMKEKAYDEN